MKAWIKEIDGVYSLYIARETYDVPVIVSRDKEMVETMLKKIL